MNTQEWKLLDMTRQELIERINLLGDEIALLKLYKRAWNKLYDFFDEDTYYKLFYEEGWQLRELMDEVSQND